MHTQRFAVIFALSISWLWLLAPPARADDAREAVKQSFIAMGFVHSYRFVTVVHNPGSSESDVYTQGESTQSPQLTHKFQIFGTDRSEMVITMENFYVRHQDRPWGTAAAQGTPPPWKEGWLHSFRRDAYYFFVRHDVLDSVPVDVYVYVLRPRDGSRIDNVIWIGTRDRLPRRLVYRFTNASGVVASVAVETVSDFNAPIKIAVPKVVPPSPRGHLTVHPRL